VALALARTRLMAARYPYFLLADSPEGVRREAEVTDLTPPAYQTDNDIRKGFSTSAFPTSRSSRSPTTRISKKA